MIIANIDDYRKKCGARLPRFLYDYISGGSYQENTLRANIAELQATLLRQRVMVDESHLNLSIHLWDEAMSLPVVLGPVGMAGMYSSRGEVKAANAAKAVGVPFTLSTMGVCDVHEVAQKTGVAPWFQLYMLKDRSFVKSVIERSVSAGSKVLVFTVDLATPGRRYSEVHDGMEKDPTLLGMLGFVAQGATHPRWALDIVTKGWPLKFGTVAEAMPKGVPYGKFVHDNFDASTTWKDIEWVRSIFPGKIILKGILDAEDAKRAVQTDIDGILVSNHGGRQLDSVTSTIRALPKVVDAVQGRVPVFMDGGIRSGRRSTQTATGHDMDHYADDLAVLTEHLNLKYAVHIGHSTGGGEVVHYLARHGESRAAKAVLISAVPPIMVKTPANPGGLSKEVFDGFP